MSKPVFSFRIDSSLYQRLNKNIKKEEIVKFVHEAIDEQLTKRELFEQKLIEGYKSVSKNKKVQKELEAWDETVSDMWKKNDGE